VSEGDKYLLFIYNHGLSRVLSVKKGREGKDDLGNQNK